MNDGERIAQLEQWKKGTDHRLNSHSSDLEELKAFMLRVEGGLSAIKYGIWVVGIEGLVLLLKLFAP